jgi:carboxypeptidase T
MGKTKAAFVSVLGLLVIGFFSLALTKLNTPNAQHSLVTIHLSQGKPEMKYLQKMDMDIAGVNLNANTVDVIVDNSELRQLSNRAEIKIVAQRVLTNMKPDEGYHTFEEVQAEVNALVAAHPNISQLISVGKSNENRDIWAVKISDNVAERETNEPTVLFNAMHHAREVMTTEVAMDTIEQLLNNYGADEKITHWVDSNEIWVIPMVNPDGNNKVWTEYSMWRKNTKGGYGVDNNRNYPYAWNTCNGSSGSTGSDTYRGPSPGSEPETQALMNAVTMAMPVMSISYHSYSELVLYPYGCSSNRVPTRDVVELVGKQMAQLLPSDDSNSRKYTPGTPWETLYDVDGGDIDWMYHERQVIPFVIEMNADDFQPDYDQYRDATVTKLRAAWGFVLDRMEKSGIRVKVTNRDVAIANEVTITVKNLTDTSIRDQIYKVNPDGTYHIVLNPGNYHLTVSGPVAQEHDVSVGDARVDMNIVL